MLRSTMSMFAFAALLSLASCKGDKATPAPAPAPAPTPASATVAPTATGVSRVAITVTADGFEPAKVAAAKGVPTTLVFTRTSDDTCAKEVVMKVEGMPDIRKELPLGKPVEIAVTFPKAGEIRYACGMDMVSGTISVQ